MKPLVRGSATVPLIARLFSVRQQRNAFVTDLLGTVDQLSASEE